MRSTDPEWMDRLLCKAQQGDEEAKRRYSIVVYEHYEGRIKRIFSKDPSIDLDDLRSTFYLGILKAIPKLDGRGSDLYHAGQRGMWAVQSEIKAVQRTMRQRAMHVSWDEPTADGLSLAERYQDREVETVQEHAIEALSNEETVKIFADVDLKPRERQAIEAILSGEAGDPREGGFNKRLAAAMDVCPQRASQVMASMRKTLESAS